MNGPKVDMKNFVECQKQFFAYFDALETYTVLCPVRLFHTLRLLDTQKYHYNMEVRQRERNTG